MACAFNMENCGKLIEENVGLRNKIFAFFILTSESEIAVINFG